MYRSGVFKAIFIGVWWVATKGREVSYTWGLTRESMDVKSVGRWIC
jgi:hypothetical protein